MLRLTGVSGEGCGMCNATQVGECIFAVFTLELMLRREVGIQMSFLVSIFLMLAQDICQVCSGLGFDGKVEEGT